jgi:hypothetical protein
VAGDRLIIWEEDEHPTKAYDPASDTWSDVATFPLGGAEGPSGPVALGDGFLVPRWGDAAIHDPATATWSTTVLPGHGDDHSMIWTGSELLMWGNPCCFGDSSSVFTRVDAWRWPLPAGES